MPGFVETPEYNEMMVDWRLMNPDYPSPVLGDQPEFHFGTYWPTKNVGAWR